MDSSSDARPAQRQRLVAVLIVVTAFVLAHAYTGIRHDGTLYLGDALRQLLPDQFDADLYFLFGSQGRFTLLPAVYAWLISAFGIGGGTIVGMLVASALYLMAGWYLVAAFEPARLRPICLLSVVLGWTLYGGTHTFAYSENFLTARSFAEPAVLFALGLLIRGRRYAALAAIVVGALVHPLIAAGGLLTGWLYLVRGDRRWLSVGVAGLVSFVALGAIGAGPFSDVFTRYDATWLALVNEINPQAFTREWSSQDFSILVYDGIALWFAARFASTKALRSLFLSALIVGLGATAASFLMVDLLENPFFGKVQLWRAEWVTQWLAMATLPLTLRALWDRGDHERVAALFLGIGWIAAFTIVPAPLALMALAVHAFRHRFVVTPSTTRIVGGVAILAAIVVTVQHEARAISAGLALDQPWYGILAQMLSAKVALLAIAVFFLSRSPRWIVAGPLIATVALISAFALWDQRSPWQRALEATEPGTTIWPGLIKPADRVYWYRDLIAPWVLLGHANYYTQQQGSGAVFSREMVVELDKRRSITQILDFQEQICRLMNTLNEKQGSCEPDVEAVRTVCTDGHVDFVVLQSLLAQTKPVASFSTGVHENGYEKRFFLYRCSAL